MAYGLFCNIKVNFKYTDIRHMQRRIILDIDNQYYRDALNDSRSMAASHNHRMNQEIEVLTPGITYPNPKQQACEGAVNPSYMNSYLNTQIGRWMNVDMQAAGTMYRKTGQLIHVGSDFIVLKLNEPLTTFISGIDSIKFITIIYHDDYNKLLMP